VSSSLESDWVLSSWPCSPWHIIMSIKSNQRKRLSVSEKRRNCRSACVKGRKNGNANSDQQYQSNDNVVWGKICLAVVG
jgi:hypothetical protein